MSVAEATDFLAAVKAWRPGVTEFAILTRDEWNRLRSAVLTLSEGEYPGPQVLICELDPEDVA